MNLNDRSLEDYYQALFAMYPTEGWRKLQEDFNRLYDTHEKLHGLETAEQLWFRKGQLDIIAMVVNHQATNEFAYNTLLAEQEGGIAEPASGGQAKVIE